MRDILTPPSPTPKPNLETSMFFPQKLLELFIVFRNFSPQRKFPIINIICRHQWDEFQKVNPRSIAQGLWGCLLPSENYICEVKKLMKYTQDFVLVFHLLLQMWAYCEIKRQKISMALIPSNKIWGCFCILKF